MKHTNIAKRVLACGLVAAMVVTGGNYSTVNVSAKKKRYSGWNSNLKGEKSKQKGKMVHKKQKGS